MERRLAVLLTHSAVLAITEDAKEAVRS